MQRFLLILASCCVLHVQCFSLLAQEKVQTGLHPALARYDAALLQLCREGRPFERASAVVYLGMSLSPELETCLNSITNRQLQGPLVLTAVLRALELSGPVGNRTPSLIAMGLKSRDPIVFGAAIHTLTTLHVGIPVDAVWPPSQAPLLWGDPQCVQWVAGSLSGISACARWNDTAWTSLTESSRKIFRPKERQPDILDLPPEAVAKQLETPGTTKYNEILGRIVDAGRTDLVEELLPKLLGGHTRAHIGRGAVALLPASALCQLLEDGPDRATELAAAELDRRGRRLSWRQLTGEEEFPCGEKPIARRRFPTTLVVGAAMQEGNEKYVQEQIRVTSSQGTEGLSWRNLWYSLALTDTGKHSSTTARQRTLKLLEAIAARHPLQLEERKYPPDAVYPRALLGLLADPETREKQWGRWAHSDSLLQDLDGIVLIAGGNDIRALALRRLLSRGWKEGWLPPEALAIEALFPLPEDVEARPDDRLLAGLEPRESLGELPSAVWKIREDLADSLVSLYSDLLNPRLAAGFLKERLSEKSLGALTLARLVVDRRKPVQVLAWRLYQRIPPGRSHLTFPTLAPQKPSEAAVLALAELQAKRSRFEKAAAKVEERGFSRAIACGIGLAPSRYAPSTPPGDFIRYFDPGIQDLFREVARTTSRKELRDASLWALWVGTHDPAIAAAWMRQARQGSPSERLDALDHLLAARWAPAAKLFPPLLDHPLPAFRFRGLEGVDRFHIEGQTEKVFALVSDDVSDVAARALALLAARGEPGVVDLLIGIAAHGDRVLARHASAALGLYHDRPTIDKVVSSLKTCVDEHGDCAPLLAAADAAVFHLGNPIGAGVSSFGEPEKSSLRWLRWWKVHSDDGLAQWVRDRYSRGLKQFPKQEREPHIKGCVALRMFLPMECSNRAWGQRDFEAARQWFGAGPSDDVFALLTHVKNGHSWATDNMVLLWHLDPNQSRSFLVRSMLGPRSMGSITGKDALDLLENLSHPSIPSPFDGRRARRSARVDRWWMWEEGEDR
jgi:hypothetical protein